MGRIWRVVGGSTAGLLVREGRDLTSPELPERLQTQSIVEELEVWLGSCNKCRLVIYHSSRNHHF